MNAHARPTWRGKDALYVARKLGLAAALKMALDPGALDSYPGTGQTWFDLTATDTDWFLGDDNGADTDDPTFNGTAGQRAAGNYWSFDGGDYFTLASGVNPAWIDAIHGPAALGALALWFYRPNTNANFAFMGNRQSSSEIGIRFDTTAGGSGAPRLIRSNGSANNSIQSALDLPVDRWSFVALLLNVAGGAGASAMLVNSSIETFDGSFPTASASAATDLTQIGAVGNNNTPLPSGSRFGMYWGWQGAGTPSVGALRALFRATRGRYGV